MSEFDTFIGIEDIDEIEDEHPVEDGKYEVCITDVKKVPLKDKPGHRLQVQCVLTEHPNAPLIFHSTGLPSASDEPRSRAFKVRELKRLFLSFDAYREGEGGLDPDWLIDQRAYVGVAKETWNGKTRNVLALAEF